MKKKVYSVAESKALVKKLGRDLQTSTGKRKGKKRGVMNLWETWWSQRLEQRKQAGEIKQWVYCEEDYIKEPKLGINYFIIAELVIIHKNGKREDKTLIYTPDFRIIENDNSIQIHEVKGFKWRESMLRFKMAATLYPNETFFLVERFNDRWIITQYGA